MCRDNTPCQLESWRKEAIHEVDTLAEAAKDIMKSDLDSIICLSSTRARKACPAFLKQLETCAKVLHANAAPRDYRKGFTNNYKDLFGHRYERHYRSEVLDASICNCPPVCISGKMRSFPAEVLQQAHRLNCALTGLSSLLEYWRRFARKGNGIQPSTLEVRSHLSGLDNAWAAFENGYLNEMIRLESEGRQPLADAVMLESTLTKLEGKSHTLTNTSSKYVEVQHKLFGRLAELNALANVKGKGRSDLDSYPLVAAQDVLRSSAIFIEDPRCAGLVHTFAEDFVDAFRDVREYLRTVGGCMERVNPYLHKNAGLASQMERLERSWEVASRYISDKPMRDALDNADSAMHEAVVLVPEFKQMCAECDPDFFLALPRMILLSFLKEPQHSALMKALLPQCFGTASAASKLGDVKDLVACFQSTKRVLMDASVAVSSRADAMSAAIWELMIQRAIHGPGYKNADAYRWIKAAQSQRQTCQDAVEQFMRELEKWSIELQRHNPTEWNDFSGLLVRCYCGSTMEHRRSTFQV